MIAKCGTGNVLCLNGLGKQQMGFDQMLEGKVKVGIYYCMSSVVQYTLEIKMKVIWQIRR